MQIFLDMDGVLCDFISAAYRVHGRKFDAEQYPKGEWYCEKEMGITASEFWQPIHEDGEAFWSGLEPYPWAKDLVSSLKSLGDVTISTSPSMSPYSYSGKRKWLRRMGWDKLPSMYGSNKHLMARPGRILVDDGMHNINAWIAEGGRAVVIPQPWNPVQHVPAEQMVSHVISQINKAV